jgi:hypothetical protein
MSGVSLKKKYLLLMLHGGLGDQLSMYFGALSLANASNRYLVVSRWTIDKTHAGSPYGILDLIPEDVQVEYHQKLFHRIQMSLHRRISGFFRPRVDEERFFRIKLTLDRLVSTVNNVVGYDYRLADPAYVLDEIEKLKRRKSIRLNCYWPSFTDSGNLEIDLTLPGLLKENHRVQSEEYAIVHFRVGDIFDLYASRGVLGVNYYRTCVEKILELEPGLKILAVSDNLERAKFFYGDLPLNWIEDSDQFDASVILKILVNSKILVTANSGLSFWAGKLGVSISKVLAPAYPTKNDLLTGATYEPIRSNWLLINNDFL